MCEKCKTLEQFDLAVECAEQIRPLVSHLFNICQALNVPFIFVATMAIEKHNGDSMSKNSTTMFLPEERCAPEMALAANILRNTDDRIVHELSARFHNAMVMNAIERVPPEVMQTVSEMMATAKALGVEPDFEAIQRIMVAALEAAGLEEAQVEFITRPKEEQAARFN